MRWPARRTRSRDKTANPQPTLKGSAQLQVLCVLGHHVEQRARLARDRVRRHHARLALDRALDGVGRHAALAVEVHERLGVPAEHARVDDRGVAADDPLGLEAVDAPLHRRGAQVHVLADVLERPPRVLAQ